MNDDENTIYAEPLVQELTASINELYEQELESKKPKYATEAGRQAITAAAQKIVDAYSSRLTDIIERPDLTPIELEELNREVKDGYSSSSTW